MILQQSEQITPLNRILLFIAAFLGFGIASLLLVAFYDALNEFHALINRIFAFSAVVLILSLVAYVSVNVFLTIEYRATENEIFKQSRQQLIIGKTTSPQQLGNDADDIEERILELYDEMTTSNTLSMNQICLEIYGKKGGTYNDKVREVLRSNDRI